jgi:Cu+-exporting ATPase
MLVNQKLADPSADRNERPQAKQQHSHIDHDATASVANKTVTDPVCGMAVNLATTPHRHQHLDKTYYFCSAGCQTKFAADPARYLKGKSAPSEPVAEGAI